jgi:hypothetical protein
LACDLICFLECSIVWGGEVRVSTGGDLYDCTVRGLGRHITLWPFFGLGRGFGRGNSWGIHSVISGWVLIMVSWFPSGWWGLGCSGTIRLLVGGRRPVSEGWVFGMWLRTRVSKEVMAFDLVFAGMVTSAVVKAGINCLDAPLKAIIHESIHRHSISYRMGNGVYGGKYHIGSWSVFRGAEDPPHQ